MAECKKGYFSTIVVLDFHSSSTTIQDVKKLLQKDKAINFPYTLSAALDRSSHPLGVFLLEVPRSRTCVLNKFHNKNFNGRQISVLTTSPGLRVWRSIKKIQQYGKKDFVTSADILTLKTRHKPILGTEADVACDLTASDIRQDVDKVLWSAYEKGIKWINIPGMNFHQCQRAQQLVDAYKDVYPLYFTAGVHPTYAYVWQDSDRCVRDLETLYHHSHCLGMGLIGLDYREEVFCHRNTQHVQKHVFETQLQLACDRQKPILLIQNNAHEDFMEIMNKYRDRLPKCALVDFSIHEERENIKQYADLGLYFVLTGLASRAVHLCYIHHLVTEGLADETISPSRVILGSLRTSSQKSALNDKDPCLPASLKSVVEPQEKPEDVIHFKKKILGDLIADDKVLLQNSEDFFAISNVGDGCFDKIKGDIISDDACDYNGAIIDV